MSHSVIFIYRDIAPHTLVHCVCARCLMIVIAMRVYEQPHFHTSIQVVVIVTAEQHKIDRKNRNLSEIKKLCDYGLRHYAINEPRGYKYKAWIADWRLRWRLRGLELSGKRSTCGGLFSLSLSALAPAKTFAERAIKHRSPQVYSGASNLQMAQAPPTVGCGVWPGDAGWSYGTREKNKSPS